MLTTDPCFRASKINFSPCPILICLCSRFYQDVEYGRNIFVMELSYQKSHGMTTTISISRYLNRLFKFTMILSDLIRLVLAVREFQASLQNPAHIIGQSSVDKRSRKRLHPALFLGLLLSEDEVSKRKSKSLHTTIDSPERGEG